MQRVFKRQVEAGVPLFPIAQAMGHKDTRMLERVYGRQTPEQLAAIMARAMGLPVNSDCSSIVAAAPVLPGFRAPDRPDGPPVPVTEGEGEDCGNAKPHQAFADGGALMNGLGRVPGGGIEPPTRGFSGLTRSPVRGPWSRLPTRRPLQPAASRSWSKT